LPLPINSAINERVAAGGTKVARIVLYSQPGCPSCAAAKEFLSSRGLSYEEKNIRTDPEALRVLTEELHSQATPTLVVGEKIIAGFDPERYEAALANPGS
jgi:glutaredoxin-like YruB-family protein